MKVGWGEAKTTLKINSYGENICYMLLTLSDVTAFKTKHD